MLAICEGLHISKDHEIALRHTARDAAIASLALACLLTTPPLLFSTATVYIIQTIRNADFDYHAAALIFMTTLTAWTCLLSLSAYTLKLSSYAKKKLPLNNES